MIEVILLERIERLGSLGQTVKVRPGFARNYLLPKKKALRATKANLEFFEKQRAEIEARNAADRAKAEVLATTMGGLSLVVVRQASELGMLFGSVTARDIVEVAAAAGHKIDRLQVQIDSPIKTLGLFDVKVKLHAEVMTKVVVNVARSPEEALVQAQKSAAKAKAAAEKAQVEAVAAAAVEAPAASASEEAPATEEKPKKAAKKTAKKTEDDASADEAEAKPKKAAAKKSKKADAE